MLFAPHSEQRLYRIVQLQAGLCGPPGLGRLAPCLPRWAARESHSEASSAAWRACRDVRYRQLAGSPPGSQSSRGRNSRGVVSSSFRKVAWPGVYLVRADLPPPAGRLRAAPSGLNRSAGRSDSPRRRPRYSSVVARPPTDDDRRLTQHLPPHLPGTERSVPVSRGMACPTESRQPRDDHGRLVDP